MQAPGALHGLQKYTSSAEPHSACVFMVRSRRSHIVGREAGSAQFGIKFNFLVVLGSRIMSPAAGFHGASMVRLRCLSCFMVMFL